VSGRQRGSGGYRLRRPQIVSAHKVLLLLVIGAIAAAASMSRAQEAPEAASASDADDTAALIAKANAAAAANAKAAETPAAAPKTENEPTADARKKAQVYGFHAEIYNGKMMFCKDDATLGTRLASKKCMDTSQFEDYAVQLQIARDLMKQKATCQGGGLCGGLP
jgi:zona occludens toxin (predicted ATPase)